MLFEISVLTSDKYLQSFDKRILLFDKLILVG